VLHNGGLVRWWEPNKDDPDDEAHRAGALLEETALIEQRQNASHELFLWNSTLLTNRELPDFRWGQVDAAETELWPTNLRTENLVAEIGEAMLSKACSSPLKPTPVPHGMSWKTERAVRMLDQFIFGVWRQVKAEDACVQMFRDAYMAGAGCVRVSFDKRDDSLHVAPVFPDSIVIDNRECHNRRQPRVYRIREVLPRADVEERYGHQFDERPLGKQGKYHDSRQVADGWVVVVTAWRLPGPDGKGGRCTTVACDRVLEDKAWKHDWVPLVFFHWQDRTSGFAVQSGVEQVVPFQVIQDELNDDIRESQDIACRPRMKINANAHIDVSQWDNAAGRFLMWSGSEPEPLIWPTNLNELYNERERNRARCFSRMGLSEMFANADLPEGVRLDSSAGVREFRNLEDGRHLRLWSNFEAARLAVAKTILLVLSISPSADAFTTMYHPGGARASAEKIPWEAVKDLTADKFSWTLEATPLSQMSPAARRELVRDWTSRGLLQSGSDEARRMEGNPNLERIEELELSGADDIVRHIGILEKGNYSAPNELTNCTLGIQKVTANYHRLHKYYDDETGDSDVPEEIFQNHIKWIVAAVAIQQAAVAPPPMTAFQPTQGMAGTSSATVAGGGVPGPVSQ
jgi:hypothetical protein